MVWGGTSGPPPILARPPLGRGGDPTGPLGPESAVWNLPIKRPLESIAPPKLFCQNSLYCDDWQSIQWAP